MQSAGSALATVENGTLVVHNHLLPLATHTGPGPRTITHYLAQFLPATPVYHAHIDHTAPTTEYEAGPNMDVDAPLGVVTPAPVSAGTVNTFAPLQFPNQYLAEHPVPNFFDPAWMPEADIELGGFMPYPVDFSSHHQNFNSDFCQTC